MDIVAATFDEAAQAGLAASHLASELGLDEDLVTVESIPDAVAAEDDGGTLAEAILVAWVPEDERKFARDLIGRHCGHHVPFDWVVALHARVGLESFPVRGARGAG
jgi:hypothetical protein